MKKKKGLKPNGFNPFFLVVSAPFLIRILLVHCLNDIVLGYCAETLDDCI